eukprot:10194764-Alexandrium_andersonii.AAC.1
MPALLGSHSDDKARAVLGKKKKRFRKRRIEWPRNSSPNLPRGAFCAVVRADSESGDGGGSSGGSDGGSEG